MPDFTELKQRAAAVWSAGAFEEAGFDIEYRVGGPVKMMLDNLEGERREQFVEVAKERFESSRQPDGTYRDEREYLFVTGIRKNG